MTKDSQAKLVFLLLFIILPYGLWPVAQITQQSTTKHITNSLNEKRSTSTQIPRVCILFLQLSGENVVISFY